MPIKLGAAFGNDSIGVDFSEIRDVVQAIEGVGFDSISTNDHVVGGHPDRLADGIAGTTSTGVPSPTTPSPRRTAAHLIDPHVSADGHRLQNVSAS